MHENAFERTTRFALLEEVLPLLPAAPPEERLVWRSYPPEDLLFEALVRDVFANAIAYATRIGLPPMTNAVIDFRELHSRAQPPRAARAVHSYEDGDFRAGGWVAPNLWHVGCVSRQSVPEEERAGFPCHVIRYHRAFTLLSLDAPTVSFGITMPVDDTFWGKVIHRLVRLPPARNSPTDWLQIFFRYCAGKVVAFFSNQPPSPAVCVQAARNGVLPIHVPLRVVANEALAAYQCFHLLRMTVEQWDALAAMVGDGIAGMDIPRPAPTGAGGHA